MGLWAPWSSGMCVMAGVWNKMVFEMPPSQSSLEFHNSMIQRPPLSSAATKGTSECFLSRFPLFSLLFSPSFTESITGGVRVNERSHLATARQKLMSLHVVTKVLLSLRCMKYPRTPANCGI